MSEIPIPIVKLRPDMVFDILNIIKSNEGSPHIMKNEIINYFIEKSSRIKKRTEESEKSLIRGVTLPSLRTLELIIGLQPNIILNVNGKKILKTFSDGGIVKAKKTLGTLLYKIDDSKCQLLSTLIELNKLQKKKEIGYDILFKKLTSKYEILTEKDERILKDRLGRWLHYFEYVDFVKKDTNLKVNVKLIKSYTKKKHIKVPKKKFIKAVLNEYNMIKKERGLVHVSIPQLYDAVWEKFPAMWKWNLDEYLEDFWKKGDSKHIILLSEPMQRKEGGIRIGDKYYYYISVHRK